MKLLVDTQAFLWIVKADERLSRTARDAFLEATNPVYLSLASIWELAIKISIGKLTIDAPLDVFVAEHVKGNDIQIAQISLAHLYRIETLPFFHRDPFDRLIIAQCLADDYTVLSADTCFDAYAVRRMW
jgi:PIN domain nuclease of toxin-antitoxin system